MLFVWTLNKHVYTTFAYSYFLGAENLQSFIYLIFLICMVTIKINKYIYFFTLQGWNPTWQILSHGKCFVAELQTVENTVL